MELQLDYFQTFVRGRTTLGAETISHCLSSIKHFLRNSGQNVEHKTPAVMYLFRCEASNGVKGPGCRI